MSAVKTEHVLVIPTALLHELGHFQGFTGDTDRYLQALLKSDQLSYRPREAMEQDPSFKQLIPYVMFQYDDADGIQHVFQYTRGNGQGEARLHAKLSIGIGGHISSEDAGQGKNAYAEGMRRELAEEVTIDTAYNETCIGLINDDQTEVGRVHLGVVHRIQVAEPRVTPNEIDIAEAGFQPVSELAQSIDRMETWSQIAFERLFSSRD